MMLTKNSFKVGEKPFEIENVFLNILSFRGSGESRARNETASSACSENQFLHTFLECMYYVHFIRGS